MHVRKGESGEQGEARGRGGGEGVIDLLVDKLELDEFWYRLG